METMLVSNQVAKLRAHEQPKRSATKITTTTTENSCLLILQTDRFREEKVIARDSLWIKIM